MSGRWRYNAGVIGRTIQVLSALCLGVLTTISVAWWFSRHETQLAMPYLIEPPGARIVAPLPPGAASEPFVGGVVSIEAASFPGTKLWSISRHQADWLRPDFVSRGDLHLPAWIGRLALPWEHSATWEAGLLHDGTILTRGWPVPTMWSNVRTTGSKAVFEGGGVLFRGLACEAGPTRTAGDSADGVLVRRGVPSSAHLAGVCPVLGGVERGMVVPHRRSKVDPATVASSPASVHELRVPAGGSSTRFGVP